MIKPRRSVTLTLNIGADTRADLIADLHHIIGQIKRGEMSTGCMGGPTCGYTYSYHEHDGPTHDEYFRQVDEWLAEREGIES